MMYPEPVEQAGFVNDYPYPATEQQSYDFQSLEQIANEVLDMNDRHHEDPLEQNNENVHGSHTNDTVPMPHAVPKPDESVDSGVSLSNNHSNTEGVGHVTTPVMDPAFSVQEDNKTAIVNGETNADHHDAVLSHVIPPVQSIIEPGTATNGVLSETIRPTSASASKTDVSGLPLYQPPAPVSQSPEATKRQPCLPNGSSTEKRKRESMSATPRPSTAQIAKVDGDEHATRDDLSVVHETDDERMARLLQQEELGLRRRNQ